MKTNCIKYVLTIYAVILVNLLVGQTYPIESSILLSPPYPTNLDAYVDFLDQGIIQVNNSSGQTLEVYFDISLAETSGKISINSNGALGTPVSIMPGQNILTPNDIEDIFAGITESDFNTAGLSQSEREAIILNRQMPEGSYQLCIKAFDDMTNPLSDPSMDNCATFDVFFAERPTINTPFDGDELEESEFLSISWDHVINSPEAQSQLEYILKLIDLTEHDIKNVELAMLDPGTPTVYEENLGHKFFANLQKDVDVLLEAGHRYAMRVTAIDPDNQLGFQYGGHSEIVSITYGSAEEDEGDASEPWAAPEILYPTGGTISMDKDSLALSIQWRHDIEEDSLSNSIQYHVKLVDMDELVITEIGIDDFKNDNYNYIFDQKVTATKAGEINTSVLFNKLNTKLKFDHQYAIVLVAETEQEDVEIVNDGYADLVKFIIGEKKNQVDDEEACGGECLAALPSDQKSSAIKKGDKLFMGNVMLTVDKVNNDSQGSYSGEGSIFINFIRQVRIKVRFSQLQANKQKYVFAGSARAIYDDSLIKADGIVSAGLSGALNIDFEAAKNLSASLRSAGKLASALAGKTTTLPLGFDKKIQGDTMVVGITEMNFSPTKATMTALVSLQNPDWGDYVPTMGATNICFTRNGFGEVVKLFLQEDYNIPLTNEDLILKASKNNTAQEKGTYCTIDCNGFKEGQITAELAIPRDILLPEKEDGTIAEDGKAKMLLSGTFTKGSGYMLSASMSPCQLPGLEGFSLVLNNGYYDHSDEVNPGGIKFPQGYTRQETDKLWKGVWFENVMIKAPQGWGFAPGEERTSVGIKNFIKDAAGISVVGEATNLLSIEKGEVEGFAISIDSIQLNIIRNQFKQVNVSGMLGLPILPEDSYLGYTGIVDRTTSRDDKEKNNNAANNAAAAQALSMKFVVTPDKEGYDIDWLKSKLEFDESSEFILKNDNKEKGFSAKMAGVIRLDIKEDSGLPEIELPGLQFEGMEISRLVAKNQQKNSKKSAKSFVFKAPKFSLDGEKFGDDKSTEDEDVAEQEDSASEDQSQKVNGFGFELTEASMTMADGDEAEMKEGAMIKFTLGGQLNIVKADKKKTAGKKAKKGLELSATGQFAINAEVRKVSNKYGLKYDSFDSAELSIEGQHLGPIAIEGTLGIYNNDDDFGKGFVGDLHIEVPMISVDVEGRFGNKSKAKSKEESFNYFYLFGKLNYEPGIPIPATPIKLHSLLGGAYANMSIKPGGEMAESARDKYIPDESISFGFRAGLGFSVVSPSTALANMTFEMALTDNGGIERIALDGQLDMFQSEPFKDLSGEDFEGLRLRAVASVLPALKDNQGNFVEGREHMAFKCNFKAKANIAEETIVGAKVGEEPYVLTDGILNFKNEVFELELGTLDNKGVVKVKLGEQADITGAFYVQASKGKTVSFPKAPVPQFIHELLNRNSDENFAPEGGDPLTGKKANHYPTDGLAMVAGLMISAEAKVDVSIIYAQFKAMLGFDLSLQTNKNVSCSNNNNKPIGMGKEGYYAQGQVYAGLDGKVGLNVNVFGYKGKVELAHVYAAMLIQGGFANPSWVKGYATLGYSVLDGLVTGQSRFEISIGEKCEAYVSEPFSGVKFLEGIDPSENKKGVSPFVKPIVSFQNKMGRYKFKNRSGDMMHFDVRLEEFYINGKSYDTYLAQDKLSAHINVTKLESYTNYTIKAKVKVYKWVNSDWVPAKDDKGELVEEVMSHQFTTGKMPDYVPWENVTDCYPFRGEKYYMIGDNVGDQCIIKLNAGQQELFEPFTPSGQQWHSKVYAYVYNFANSEWLPKSEVKYVPRYRGGRHLIYFKLPSGQMSLNSDHYLKIVREWYRNDQYDTSKKDIADDVVVKYQKGEGINYTYYTFKKEGKHYANAENKRPSNKKLFDYSFHTSKYRTFSDKVKSGSHTYRDRQNYSVLQYNISNSEPFSQDEVGYRYIAESRSVNKEFAFIQEDINTFAGSSVFLEDFNYTFKRFNGYMNSIAYLNFHISDYHTLYKHYDLVNDNWKRGLDPKSLRNRYLYAIDNEGNGSSTQYVSTLYTKLAMYEDIKNYDWFLYCLLNGVFEDQFEDDYPSKEAIYKTKWYETEFDASKGLFDSDSDSDSDRNYRSNYYLRQLIAKARNDYQVASRFYYHVPYYGVNTRKLYFYESGNTYIKFNKN